MLCENCKLNNATKKCVMQTNFFEKETYLCSDCYERLYNKKIKVDTDIFGNIFGTTFGGFKVVRDKVCDNCGLSLSQFEKNGVAGCENCYNVFGAEIESFIKKQQGKTIHIGKSPKSYKNVSELMQKKQALQTKLNEAVKTNNAAEINNLKKEIESINKHIQKISKGE